MHLYLRLNCTFIYLVTVLIFSGFSTTLRWIEKNKLFNYSGLMVSRRFDDEAPVVGGRWATSSACSPQKTTTFSRVTTAAAGCPVSRVPASPTAGATNDHVDASDYLQPMESRAAEPSASARWHVTVSRAGESVLQNSQVLGVLKKPKQKSEF